MTRPRRLLLTGGVLTLLLALVAVASRAHRPGGGSGGGGGGTPPLLREYIGVTMFVLLLIFAVVMGYGLADSRRRKTLAGETNWRRKVAGTLVVIVALAVGLLVTRNLKQNTAPAVQPPAGIGGPLLRGSEVRPAPGRRQPRREASDPGWVTALMLGSLLLGTAVAIALAVRHRRTHGEELEAEAAIAEALEEVLADTLDDLRAEHDPRSAVIQAYARMERTFGAYRVPRDPAETPLEYVARVLDSLRVSGHAVRRLTLLFERAKFSTHEVDDPMKDEAIETLAALRGELEAHRQKAAA